MKSILFLILSPGLIHVHCKLQVKLKKIRKPKAHSKFQVELLKSDQEIKEQFSSLLFLIVSLKLKQFGLISKTQSMR